MTAAESREVPVLWPGTEVEVCPDESMGVTHIGFVVTPNGTQPNILAYNITPAGGLEFVRYQYCLHINDPKLESVKNEIRADAFRGVFRLSHNEIQRRKLIEGFAGLEQGQLDLGRQLAALQSTVDDLTERVNTLEEIARRKCELAREPEATGTTRRKRSA